MAVNYERGATSKKRLSIRWSTPVPTGEEALDFQTSLKEIRGNDPRPLLVLRDCDRCNGKDDALLSKTLNNERTQLYTQWFHCVKLDRQVVEKSHPWHALFAGKKPRHLFLTSWDGKKVVALPGTQTQKDLWGVLQRILKVDYKKVAKPAVRSWQRVLDSYDAIDSRQKELERQLDMQLVAKNKQRIARIQKRLSKLANDRKANEAKEKAVMNLVLRHAPKAKTVDDFDNDAAGQAEAGSGSELLDRIRKGKKTKGAGSSN